MPVSRTCRPPTADAGGRRDPYRSTAFNPGAAAAAASDNDYSSHPAYTQKHRGRAFTDAGVAPPSKRRKPATATWELDTGKRHQNSLPCDAPSTSSACFPPPRRHDAGHGAPSTREQSEAARSEEEAAFMSRDEIERCSPSRKDGIDVLLEMHLRYSYCAYLQSLGTTLQLPQTTIGTAMVLCHRFFVRRSHACHDRFLIATAALFLASKSEETPILLNTVLRTSCEICQKQNFAFSPYLLCSDWFEQYRERIIEAEQMILMTLDFELDVKHPYIPLASVLNKLGLSQTVLLNLAWNLVNQGLRTSLWLQFKPHHIAAGAAFLAAKFLNFDLSLNQTVWHEFQTTPSIIQDVVQQLMELF